MTSSNAEDLDVLTFLSDIEVLKGKGNSHFKAKDYHHAIRQYDEVIEEYNEVRLSEPSPMKQWKEQNSAATQTINKMIGATYNNRAFCYFRLEMYGAAADDATHAIKLKFWKGYYRRGCSNAALGNWNKARKDFTKANAKFPKNMDIRNKLQQATKAYQQKKFFEAIYSEDTDNSNAIAGKKLKMSELPAIPSTYTGPRIDPQLVEQCINEHESKSNANTEENDANPLHFDEQWMHDLHDFQKSGKYLPARYTAVILLQVLKLFKQCKNIEHYDHSAFVPKIQPGSESEMEAEPEVEVETEADSNSNTNTNGETNADADADADADANANTDSDTENSNVGHSDTITDSDSNNSNSNADAVSDDSVIVDKNDNENSNSNSDGHENENENENENESKNETETENETENENECKEDSDSTHINETETETETEIKPNDDNTNNKKQKKKKKTKTAKSAAHITVCGDIHGQYYDYLHIFAINAYPSPSNPYLFNGDFVDRGSWSLEVILSMFCFKLLYPRHFHMIRGNHETINMNNMYGFKGEVEHKYAAKSIGKSLFFPLFTQIFNYLPLGYDVGHEVFVCHGGLCKQTDVKVADIQAVDRACQPSLGIMSDLLWSDPQDMNGLAPSKRGGGTMFGPDITARFLALNGFKLLIRSHEVQEQGYSVAHNGKCVTIFSAPNYVDQMGNKGAFIKLDGDYKPHYTQYTAQPHPNIKPMAYGGGLFNFANFM